MAHIPHKALVDVNYIENALMDELPTGYGAYHKQSEIDTVNAAIESC
jgi:hypothetical protein